MRTKLFGRSGLRVSELCLGTMTFGKSGDRGSTLAECAAMFHDFTEHGGNFVDTAASYGDGNAEWIIGELAADRRDQLVLATRVTVPDTFLDPHGRITASVEGSLGRLRTDRIDLLWLDGWAPTTAFDEVMGAVESLIRAGKVLYVGVADTPTWVASQANTLADLHGWTPFIGLQIEYSLVERKAERDALPMAEALGLSVVPWGALGGGILCGKYPRQRLAGLMNERSLLAIDRICSVARDLGRAPAQVALSWVRQQGANMVPILGARTSAQLSEDLGCLDLTLTSAQLGYLCASRLLESETSGQRPASEEERASA